MKNNVTIIKYNQWVSLSVAALAVADASAAGNAENSKPNIVLILADDFGVGDIHAYYPDNIVQTPCLDQFSREGVIFTDAHSGAACCTPSRYGVLTGRYAWRSRLQRYVLHEYDAPLIKPEQLTLAEMLKSEGYATACVGKWHLGHDWAVKENGDYDYEAGVAGGAVDHGFDVYFGTDVPNFAPYTFIENHRLNPLPSDWMPEGTERWIESGPCAPGWRFDQILPQITQRAVDYVHEQAKNSQPFFLLFSMTSPHEPVSPSPNFKGINEHIMLDFLQETDWSVGQVLQALDQAGLRDDTVVIFTSDNGASGYAYRKEMLALGVKRDGIYRGHKGHIYEGGHRVPFIVRWPKIVAAGEHCDRLICVNDILATCAEILGIHLPEDQAPDSISFLSVLKNPAGGSERTTMVHHSSEGQFAFREGDWKMVVLPADETSGETLGFELYNLKNDPVETKDLAQEYPERISQMKEILAQQIQNGRSTSGPALSNDRPVHYQDAIPASEYLYR